MACQKPSQDELHESWVNLEPQQNPESGSDPVIETPVSINNGALEKMLIEAQRESRTPSFANSKESSARGSPKSPHSPNSEWAPADWRTKQDVGTDWIWDWSSGPEIKPSSDWNEKFRHPGGKPRRTVPNTRKAPVVKTGLFSFENLPSLLLTHACTFFLGAAVMFIYLKKCCHWSAVAPSALH